MGTPQLLNIAAITIALLTVGCGDAGGAGGPGGIGNPGGNSAGGGNGSSVTVRNLERDFPIRENGSFGDGIQQSFVCIDQVEQAYYQLVFDRAGNVTAPEFGISLTYTTTNDVLDIDMTNAFGPGVSYQHSYHMHAGELVVGFIGNLTDGVDNAAIACIAAEHDYSDSVPTMTTIACRSGSPNNSFDFSEDSTNIFSLEPGHYAQRNFRTFSYSGGGVDTLNLATERVDHGTYLYDERSGEFVLGFMRVDIANADAELLVFEGQSNGSEVTMELGQNSRGCAFE